MSTLTLAAVATLMLASAPQDETALRDGLADALGERRTDVRVITVGGPGGPGRMDADEDGFVTREEFTAPLAGAFERLDADDDGRLSREELSAGHGEGHDGPGAHEMILRHGGSGHGGPAGDVMIHRGPAGGDREVFMFRHGGPGGHDGPGGERVEIRRFGGPHGQADLDTDSDGRVTEAEFLAPLREAFRRMDADSDGALAEGEHRAPARPSAR